MRRWSFGLGGGGAGGAGSAKVHLRCGVSAFSAGYGFRFRQTGGISFQSRQGLAGGETCVSDPPAGWKEGRKEGRREGGKDVAGSSGDPAGSWDLKVDAAMRKADIDEETEASWRRDSARPGAWGGARGGGVTSSKSLKTARVNGSTEFLN